MQQKPQHVLIGVLSQEMMIHASLAWVSLYLPVWTSDESIPYVFSFWIEAGNSPQPYKRNAIIEQAQKIGADICIQIDDDMIVNGTSLLDLLNTPDWDIVAPLQYTMKGIDPQKGRTVPECFPCAFMIDKENGGQMLPVWPKVGDVVDVDIVGSGVIAIHRRVFDDVRMMNECDEKSPPPYFRDVYQGNGRRTCGLDVDFCKRAKALDYRIKVNWGVEVGHFKRVCLNDIDLYAKSQFAMGLKFGGDRDGIRVEAGQGGPQNGTSGIFGPGEARDEVVGSVGLDRAEAGAEADQGQGGG